MNFFKAFYITGATSLLVTVIAFFNNIIITRYLGPTGRGKYSIVLNTVTILALVFGEGLRRSNILFTAKNKNQIIKIAKRTFYYFLVLVIIALFLYLLFASNFSVLLKINSKFVLLSLLTTTFVILWRSLQSIFLGIEDFKSYNFTQLFYTLLIFLSNVFIVYIFKLSIFEIIFNFIVVSFIVFIYEIFRLKELKINIIKNSDNDKKNNSLVLRATIASIFSFILLKGDIFIVNYFLNSSTTGIYSITLVITDLFQKLPLILGPIIIARSANRNLQKEVLNISKMSRVLIIINIIAVIFVFFIGKWLIVFFFSSSFINSFFLLIYILPALVIFSSGHIVHAFLMGQGFPNFLIVNNIIFSLLDVVLNIIFIPKYGIKAAAISCSVSYFLWSISFISYFVLKYNVKVKDMLLVKSNDFIFIKKNII